MSENTVLLATSAAGLGLVGLLSLPAVANTVIQLRARESKSEIYEDEDGKSTPESVKAYSAKLPKAFIIFFSVVGLGLSIAVAVVATLGETTGLFLENWLAVGTWVR
jgi:hypothetical protein